MAKIDLDELLKLPAAERLELAMALWDSIEQSPEADSLLPLTDAQRAGLDRRLAEHEHTPGSGIPWEAVKRRLRARLGGD
jgi:putative addiction module component (TIGR02574 family)